jgi:hypothetical protein
MFTSNYHGVISRKVDFYGNDAVCLFKYFVDSDDPQKLYVWLILLVNFACFTVISISYILIGVTSTISTRNVAQGRGNNSMKDRNRKMNRKIAIIILTDFSCWMPFIIICGLHTLGVIDASSWYALFSIVVLPINSVINPILYDNSIVNAILTITRGRKSQRATTRSFVDNRVPMAVSVEEAEPIEQIELDKKR